MVNAGVVVNGQRYPVIVSADYECNEWYNGGEPEMVYSAMTQESYVCLDGVRRNFTATGPTLQDCLARVVSKIFTHLPQ